MGDNTRLRRRWTNAEVVVFPTAILSEQLSPTALRLWIALAQFANDERQCWPSRRRLLEMMPPSTARSTLRRARAELEAAHLLDVEVRTDARTGRNTTPLYTLFVPVGEGGDTAPGEGGETVPPVGGETAPPKNLTKEPEQKEEVVDEVRVVFDAWVDATGKDSGRTRLDEKRRRTIGRALEAHPIEDVLDAVVGWRHDAFYCGENDRGRAFNDLGLLLRDAEHVERFRDMARREATTVEPVNPNERRDADGNVTHRHSMGTGWSPVPS